MLQIGSLVDGKYKILNKVGQGGMSVVYLAMNEKANKQWAVKEVRKDGVLDFEAVKQGLVAETDILKKLSHPNLPSIVDVIDTDEAFIIIMDYIQGNSLSKALQEFGAQPQENVIEWAKQLCDVLGYLHSQNPPIIYRDMKPANIMLKPDGNVTLIDFGTAREYKEKNLADTTCLGTIGYAAPEQFGGMGQTDARTDIYCLGATLYHLVTGMNPCEPPYEIKPIRQINPNLSSGLERIIQKCTQRDPNDRYQSAAELMYALEHYEEIDDIYRSKQKKKLIRFLIPAALTLIFAGVSVWAYFAAQNTLSDDYDHKLQEASMAAQAQVKEAEADQTVVKLFHEAILTDTTRTEAYIGNGSNDGLIDYLLKDGQLSQTEGGYINSLVAGLGMKNSSGFSTTVKVLDELANTNPDGYQDVCLEIGEAYLFYYDIGVEKDKYKAASAWFEKATGKYPEAQLYCDINTCLKDIDDATQSGWVNKKEEKYTELWDLIGTLKTTADAFDDGLRLRTWQTIVNMINVDGNGDYFSEVAEGGKDEVTALLKDIWDRSGEITSSFAKDSVTKLQESIIAVNKKYEFSLFKEDKATKEGVTTEETEKPEESE